MNLQIEEAEQTSTRTSLNGSIPRYSIIKLLKSKTGKLKAPKKVILYSQRGESQTVDFLLFSRTER